MLRQQWKKITEMLPEPVKDYVAGARYIKLDGTPYYSTGVSSFLHRPEVKLGMLTAGFNAAAIGFAAGAFMPAVMNLALSTVMIGFISEIYRYMCLHSNVGIKNKQDRAIDTEGRDLSRVQLSLNDRRELVGVRGASFFVGGVMAINSISLIDSAAAMVALPFYVSAITACASMMLRSTKLLNQEYCFCDEPPAQRRKSKKSSMSLNGKLA